MSPPPIPFVREMDLAYGRADAVSPLVRRVTARNPGPLTFHGTGTYVVGRARPAVIDPGPDLPAHLEALMAALGGERPGAIVVTHDHHDHSPAAAALARLTGAEVVGAAPGPQGAGRDATYRPDRVLADGETLSGPGWTLAAVHTPGHTANHLCFRLLEEDALFTGDHVMGWSTTVVAPPDGDMAAYIASLRRVRALRPAALLPAHGPPVTRPGPFLDALIAHRLERERRVLQAVREGCGTPADIVARLYAGLDPRLNRAAAASVLAHLIRLEADGLVVLTSRTDDARARPAD